MAGGPAPKKIDSMTQALLGEKAFVLRHPQRRMRRGHGRPAGAHAILGRKRTDCDQKKKNDERCFKIIRHDPPRSEFIIPATAGIQVYSYLNQD